MKVLHLSTSDKGGAGIAASRLHAALRKKGIDSTLLTYVKYTENLENHYRFSHSSFPISKRWYLYLLKLLKKLRLYQPPHIRLKETFLKNQLPGFELFSFMVADHDLNEHILVKESDIIHIHWVCDGFLDFESFFQSQSHKIVWTLHDMNPFTGGCHHSDVSTGYEKDCSMCPQLAGTPDQELAFKMLEKKQQSFNKTSTEQIKIVAPSKWLRSKSERSTLFGKLKHYTIPNGVDITKFRLFDKSNARAALNLPVDKKIILFVSHTVSNPRKGFHYLLEAYQMLSDNNVFLCCIGTVNESAPIGTIQLGYISDDEKLAQAYSAADLFVLPSLAENFPNTICEALLCGTPVVAFKTGGIPEQVDSSNGCLSIQINATSLKDAIETVLKTNYDRSTISRNAQEKYADDLMAEKYISIYKELIP